jgi:hypothetical protein
MHIFGYIDPGIGALIWQSIIGIFVGVLFYLRKTRRWIGQFIGKIFPGGQKPTNSAVNLPLEKDKVEADQL